MWTNTCNSGLLECVERVNLIYFTPFCGKSSVINCHPRKNWHYASMASLCVTEIDIDTFKIILYKYPLGRGPKVKISRINKILRIQLGLYIRKPGKKSLTQKKVDFDEGDCKIVKPLFNTNYHQNPQKDTLGTKIGPRKVIFGHFAFFWYFYLIFPWARAIFFKCNPPHQNQLFLGQTFFPWLSNV